MWTQRCSRTIFQPELVLQTVHQAAFKIDGIEPHTGVADALVERVECDHAPIQAAATRTVDHHGDVGFRLYGYIRFVCPAG